MAVCDTTARARSVQSTVVADVPTTFVRPAEVVPNVVTVEAVLSPAASKPFTLDENHFRSVIEQAGAIYQGIQSGDESIGLRTLILFASPETNTTLAITPEDFSLTKVREKLQESNQKFAGQRTQFWFVLNGQDQFLRRDGEWTSLAADAAIFSGNETMVALLRHRRAYALNVRVALRLRGMRA